MKELSTLRLQIDEIDRAMTELLVRRMDVSREIAKAKQSTALPVTDPAREALILSRAREAAAPYGEEGCRLMRLLMDLSKRRQALEAIPRISLIGMPGCGKTTVGRLLAEKLGRPFFDADEELEKTAGKPIPEIFLSDGEDAFRRLETEILCKLGKSSGAVIATGGGCVTRAGNYALLHQNGTIIRLTRELDSLSVAGRPISQKKALQDLPMPNTTLQSPWFAIQ